MRIKLRTLVIDCADVRRASDFYARLLGWETTVVQPDWVLMRDPAGGTGLSFQAEADYQPPVWPEEPFQQQKMLHMDFLVDSLPAAEAHAIALGAVKAPRQFLDGVIVFFDPDGHPFCLFEDPDYAWPPLEMEYRELGPEDITPGLLKDFVRHQEVTRCFRKEDGAWGLKDIAFTEDWGEADKRRVEAELADCVRAGGFAAGAFAGEQLIGFAALAPGFFGPFHEYLQLSQLHVSHGWRGKGAGRKLFEIAATKARGMGAAKLYISAHSAQESQTFYRALGCADAVWVHPGLAEAEPCDCQLEYPL